MRKDVNESNDPNSHLRPYSDFEDFGRALTALRIGTLRRQVRELRSLARVAHGRFEDIFMATQIRLMVMDFFLGAAIYHRLLPESVAAHLGTAANIRAFLFTLLLVLLAASSYTGFDLPLQVVLVALLLAVSWSGLTADWWRFGWQITALSFQVVPQERHSHSIILRIAMTYAAHLLASPARLVAMLVYVATIATALQIQSATALCLLAVSLIFMAGELLAYGAPPYVFDVSNSTTAPPIRHLELCEHHYPARVLTLTYVSPVYRRTKIRHFQQNNLRAWPASWAVLIWRPVSVLLMAACSMVCFDAREPASSRTQSEVEHAKRNRRQYVQIGYAYDDEADCTSSEYKRSSVRFSAFRGTMSEYLQISLVAFTA